MRKSPWKRLPSLIISALTTSQSLMLMFIGRLFGRARPSDETHRDRIVAAAAQRLAAQETQRGQVAAAQAAEARHGHARVLRAARMEAAATAEQRAQPALVTIQ
jgi:hypothetical protein